MTLGRRFLPPRGLVVESINQPNKGHQYVADSNPVADLRWKEWKDRAGSYHGSITYSHMINEVVPKGEYMAYLQAETGGDNLWKSIPLHIVLEEDFDGRVADIEFSNGDKHLPNILSVAKVLSD